MPPASEVFERLTGRQAVGEIETELKFAGLEEHENEYELVVGDTIGKSSIMITTFDTGTEFDLVSSLFYMVRKISDTSTGGPSLSQVGKTYLAQATIQGKTQLVEINRNASDENTPLTIDFVGNGPKVRLFSAALNGD